MIRKITLTSFLLLAMLTFIPLSVWAATPLLTDDPNTLGAGKGQLEICGRVGFDRDVTEGVATKNTISQVTTSFTYGVVDPVDLAFEFARTWGTSTTEGVDLAAPDAADFKLSAKIKLLEAGGLMFAVRPDLGYSYLPSGSSRDYSPFFGGAVIAGKQFDPLTFNLNLGYLHYSYQSDEDRGGLRPDIWSASFSTSWQPTEKLQLVADIGTGTNPDITTSELPLFSCFGLIYSFADYLDMAGGFKFGLNKPETDLMLQSALVLKF